MREESWSLGMDHTIDIHQAKSRRLHSLPSEPQHLAAVASAIGGIGIRKLLTNVAKRSGAKQGIGDCVEQNICVAMPNQVPVEGNLQPAESQRSAVGQSMRVVPQPDT